MPSHRWSARRGPGLLLQAEEPRKADAAAGGGRAAADEAARWRRNASLPTRPHALKRNASPRRSRGGAPRAERSAGVEAPPRRAARLGGAPGGRGVGGRAAGGRATAAQAEGRARGRRGRRSRAPRAEAEAARREAERLAAECRGSPGAREAPKTPEAPQRRNTSPPRPSSRPPAASAADDRAAAAEARVAAMIDTINAGEAAFSARSRARRRRILGRDSRGPQRRRSTPAPRTRARGGGRADLESGEAANCAAFRASRPPSGSRRRRASALRRRRGGSPTRSPSRAQGRAGFVARSRGAEPAAGNLLT